MSFWRYLTQTIFICSAGMLAGCNGDPVDAPYVSPAAAAAAAIKQYDIDGNGELSAEELLKAPALQAAVPNADLNTDACLSNSEIQTRIGKLVGEEVGFMSCMIVVNLDGSPLANAEVKLIPEECLGPTFKTAGGTTSAQGAAHLRMTGDDLPGVQCGWFRVQISKKGEGGQESLPAIYNTDTTLGTEISLENPALERGLVFNLKSKP